MLFFQVDVLEQEKINNKIYSTLIHGKVKIFLINSINVFNLYNLSFLSLFYS